MTTKPVLILQTGSIAGRLPPSLADVPDLDGAFVEAGAFGPGETVTARVFEGEEPPAPERLSAVLITGSPHMVTDQADWMKNTAHWLRQAAERDLPILGVCFGHQLLAHAFGGRVGVNPNGPELGSTNLRLTGDGRTDPLLGGLPGDFIMQMHHYESVLEPPKDATILAENGHDPLQALHYGGRVWSVQFHPEISAALMRGLLQAEREKLEDRGIDADAVIRNVDETPWGPALLRRFRDMALGLQASGSTRERNMTRAST